jgi:tetratricopeptide (TPR) repeat protein
MAATLETPRRPGLGLLALAMAGAVAFDPLALASEPKTVVLLVGAVVLAATAVTGKRRLVATWPLAFGCALSGWMLLRGGRDLAGGLVAALCFGLSLAALPRARRTTLALWACLLIGGGAGAITAFEWLRGARGMQLHGGMGNPDWLGLLMAVTLVPSGSALIRAARARKRWAPLLLLATALQGFAWVVAESRAGWLALPVGAGVALAARRVRLGFPLCGALVVASVIGARLDLSLGSGALGALAGRFWIWRSSLAAALHALPFGSGAQGFSNAYLIEQGHFLSALDVSVASRTFVHATTAHNEWLHVFTTLGVPGLVLLVAMLATGIDGAARRFPAGAGALGALAVGASADVPLQAPAILLVTALVMAAAPRLKRPTGAEWGARAAALGVLVVCAVLLEGSVRQWRATRLSVRARDAAPAERASLLARAVALTPRSAEAELAWGLDQIERGELGAGVTTLERARSLSATVSTDVALGNALVSLGRHAEARTAFERALAKNPGSFRAHANLAVALSGLGNFAGAERELSLAERLWPGHPKLPLIRESIRRAREAHETW